MFNFVKNQGGRFFQEPWLGHFREDALHCLQLAGARLPIQLLDHQRLQQLIFVHNN
jgi:hypothetical protein